MVKVKNKKELAVKLIMGLAVVGLILSTFLPIISVILK